MRISAIDRFRGLSVVLMVFFTLILKLSNDLPDVLVHNAPGSVHLGDFVLPMFLFASGMSMVFFVKKREKKKRSDYALDIIERFGKLVLIAFFLTPFSAGEWLGMDEVMLSAVLFVPTVILIGLGEAAIIAAGLSIFLLYFALQSTGLLPDFTLHYLGGYPAAIFYLPVMLGGALAGKHIDNIEKLLAGAVIMSLILLAAVPPYKLEASPSFMMVSVALSLGIFLAIRNVGERHLEYLGTKPIRYWVLMFVLLLIPLAGWCIFTKNNFPLALPWQVALLMSLTAMVFVYIFSIWADRLNIHLKRRQS